MYIYVLKIAIYLLCCLNDFTMQYYRIYNDGFAHWIKDYSRLKFVKQNVH